MVTFLKSRHFYELERRLANLREVMLPEVFDPTGNYDDRTLILTEAYIVLSHAEIESYIENICNALVLYSVKEWKKSPDTISLTLFSLVALHSGSSKNIIDVGESAYEQYQRIIRNNNGIKEQDLKKMILPTGVNFDSDLDQQWVSDMDSFGSLRGNIAHTSRLTRPIHNEVSPSDSLSKVSTLLKGLRKLDQKIIELYFSIIRCKTH